MTIASVPHVLSEDHTSPSSPDLCSATIPSCRRSTARRRRTRARSFYSLRDGRGFLVAVPFRVVWLRASHRGDPLRLRRSGAGDAITPTGALRRPAAVGLDGRLHRRVRAAAPPRRAAGRSTSRTWPTSRATAAARRRARSPRATSPSICAAVTSMNGIVSASSTTAWRRRRAAAADARRGRVGVGEEQPALDAQHRDPVGHARSPGGARRRRTGRPCRGPCRASRRAGARRGRAAAASETPMPMNRPGSVSNTSTPSIAATAATKSGRAATPRRGPADRRSGSSAAQRADVDQLDHRRDHDRRQRRLGQLLEQAGEEQQRDDRQHRDDEAGELRAARPPSR